MENTNININMTDEQAQALLNGKEVETMNENTATGTDTMQLELPYEIETISKFGENQEINTSKVTVKDFVNKVNKGVYTFDNEAQRGDVWNIEQRSKLIDSILRGIAVPCFYLNNRKEKQENGRNKNFYDVLDGRQRGTSLKMFVNDSFRLKGLDSMTVIDTDGNSHELDLNGLLFSEMPEMFQECVLDYPLEFWTYSELTQDEVDELFLRINNGTALKAQDKTRVAVKSKDKLFELSAHPVFNKILTAKGLDNKDNQDIVMKSIIMMSNLEDKSTLNKVLSPYFELNEIKDNEVTDLNAVFDFALEVVDTMLASDDKSVKKACKTWIKKSHFATSTSLMRQAINDEVSVEDFADFIANLFVAEPKMPTSNEIYNEASRVGSGSNNAVQNRLEQLVVEYNNFFEEVPSDGTDSNETETVEIAEATEEASEDTVTGDVVDDILNDVADEIEVV